MICRIRQFNPDAGSAIIQINMGNTRSTLAPLAILTWPHCLPAAGFPSNRGHFDLS